MKIARMECGHCCQQQKHVSAVWGHWNCDVCGTARELSPARGRVSGVVRAFLVLSFGAAALFVVAAAFVGKV